MLPIIRNKPLHVPHRLAAIAAAICLGLAFFSDFSERRENLIATQTESATKRFTAVVEEARGDAAAAPEQRRVDSTKSRQPTQWFPWFPGLRPGGG